MRGPTAPCESGVIDPNLWFSDVKTDQKMAKEFCQDCTLKRFQACQAEGWKHETGVWGGMSPSDRKRADPDRYEAAVSEMKRRSEEIEAVARSVAERRKSREQSPTAIPEEQRVEARPPMDRSERQRMRWAGVRETCLVEDCETRAHCRGWCVKHYHRWRSTGDPLGSKRKPAAASSTAA